MRFPRHPMPRTALALLTLIQAATLWLGYSAVRGARQRTADAAARWSGLEQAREAFRREVASLETRRQELSARLVQAVAFQAARRPAAEDPAVDDPWTTPPETLPDWNESSPYIWIPKEILGRLTASLQTFHHRGNLDTTLAESLDLSEADHQALDARLEAIVSEHREWELSVATPGVESTGNPADPVTVTIRIPAAEDVGGIYQSRFESALTESLGPQRSRMVLDAARSWIRGQFNVGRTEPKTYAVTRHPDGRQNIFVRSGDSSTSWGGPSTDLTHAIPAHLIPTFESLLPPAP